MPVQVDLNEILHHPGMRQGIDVQVPCTDELEIGCITPLTGNLVFTNTGNVLVVQGEVDVTLRSRCPRCLTDVDTRTRVPVDEEFTVEHNEITGLADEETGTADPTLQALVHAGILNVDELLRQAVVLQWTGDPLCREDCRGLCPLCGTNRNTGECSCEPERDSPFAALAGLYDQEESDTETT